MNIKFWKKKNIENEKVEINPQINFNSISVQDFQNMIKYGKPLDILGKYKSKAFIELPFGIVKKELPIVQTNDNPLDAIFLILNCQYENVDLSNVEGNDLLRFLLWIRQQQEFISNVESKNLQSTPDPEMLAAGIHRLDEFDIEPLLERIAKDWNIRPEDVEKYPYHKIYRKIKMDKIWGEIQKAHSKIIESQSKQKNK